MSPKRSIILLALRRLVDKHFNVTHTYMFTLRKNEAIST